MSTDAVIARENDSQRYEAVLRISEALCATCEPEDLAKTLADEIDRFLHFDHLYLAVFKENSKEIQFHVWGKGPIPWPDLPFEELPSWAAIDSQGPLHTSDWETEARFPRFKEWAKRMGLGSG